MSVSSKHAVLAEGKLYSYDGKQIQEVMCVTRGRDFADLAQQLLDAGISHAWLMPGHRGVLPEHGIITKEQNHPLWEFFTPRYTRDNELRLISAKRWAKGQRGRLAIQMIIFENTAWYGSGSRWGEECTVRELLATILYLEEVLGIAMGAGPGGVGWRMLKKRHPEWLEDYPKIDLRKHHFTASAGHDITWTSPDIVKLMPGMYIHKFDRSMAFPYAASFDNRYGTGTPVLELGEASFHRLTIRGTWKDDRVGVWRCTVTGEPDPRLPRPKFGDMRGKLLSDVKLDEPRTEWISGPYIRLLRHLGYKVEIHEGWVFPEATAENTGRRPHEMMARWAIDMWDAREEFRKVENWKNQRARIFAEDAVKQIAVATIGSTAFKDFDDQDEADKKRPDIRLQTVGRSAELTILTILGEQKRSGRYPVMVYADAIYYVLDHTDGRGAFPGIVKREGEFGGMRYEGYIRVVPEMCAMLHGGKPEWAKLEMLNESGWSE